MLLICRPHVGGGVCETAAADQELAAVEEHGGKGTDRRHGTWEVRDDSKKIVSDGFERAELDVGLDFGS